MKKAKHNYALMSGLIGGMVLQYIQNHLYVKYLAGSPNFTTFFSWLVLWWNTKHKKYWNFVQRKYRKLPCWWHILWTCRKNKHYLMIFWFLWMFFVMRVSYMRMRVIDFLLLLDFWFEYSLAIDSLRDPYHSNYCVRHKLVSIIIYSILFSFFLSLVTPRKHQSNCGVIKFMFYYAISLALAWKVKTPLKIRLPNGSNINEVIRTVLNSLFFFLRKDVKTDHQQGP